MKVGVAAALSNGNKREGRAKLPLFISLLHKQLISPQGDFV